MTRMRCVIELARNIRDRHNKPLKQPLRRVILSHEDAGLLRSLARPTSTCAKAEALFRMRTLPALNSGTCNEVRQRGRATMPPIFNMNVKPLVM